MFEHEDYVCVACKAATKNRIALGEQDSPLIYWCCMECLDDGTFTEWLGRELEAAMLESGRPYTICPTTGHKLFTVEDDE